MGSERIPTNDDKRADTLLLYNWINLLPMTHGLLKYTHIYKIYTTTQ